MNITDQLLQRLIERVKDLQEEQRLANLKADQIHALQSEQVRCLIEDMEHRLTQKLTQDA